MKKNEIDWMGRWYLLLKERGENDCPSLGKVNLKTKDVEWYHFSHADMDGIGALVKFYRQKNIILTNLPALKESRPPFFLECLRIFWHLFFQIKNITPQWKEHNWGLVPKDLHQLSWIILSPLETVQIEEYCRNNKIAENAFFMNVISQVLLNELTINREGTWTLPINLRPLLKRQDITSNHSSGMLVSIKNTDTAKDTHRQIKDKFLKKEHWGIWWIHQIGKIVGLTGMRHISKRNAKKTFLLGSFSNLGKWEIPPNDIWVGAAPGSKNFPIGIMIMKANGHISFSLKIHPFILKDSSQVPLLLDKIIKNILHQVANSQ